MTTPEPPSGAEDLAAQADAAARAEVAEERAQLDKDMRIAELERQLAAQRRAEDAAAPRVIEPDGSESTAQLDKGLYVLDEETDEPLQVGGQLLLKSEYPTDEQGRVSIGDDGQARTFEQVELDDDGKPILDDDGQLIPRWPHQVIEHRGIRVQVRIPKPGAITAFQTVQSKNIPESTRAELYDQFVSKHMSTLSRRHLTTLMFDPDSDFDADDWREIFRKLMTMSTGRPTKRSRS